jgi:hypothetical protein
LESSGYDEVNPLQAALLFAWSSGISHLLSVAARVRFPQGTSDEPDSEPTHPVRPSSQPALCVPNHFPSIRSAD